MAAKRVHEVAKELGIESKQLLATLEEMGKGVKNVLQSIDDETQAELAKKMKKKPEKVEKPAPKAAKPAAKAPAKAAPAKPKEAAAPTKEAPKAKTAAAKPAAPTPEAKKAAAPKLAAPAAPPKPKAEKPTGRVPEAEKPKAAVPPKAPAPPPKAPAAPPKAPAGPPPPPRREAQPRPGAGPAGRQDQAPRQIRPAGPHGQQRRMPTHPRSAPPRQARPEGRRPAQPAPAPAAPAGAEEGKKRHLRLPQGITVKDFAQKVGKTPGEIIRLLMALGEMVTMNQSISDEALRVIAEELGYEIDIKSKYMEEPEIEEDAAESLKSRPPVVTVMGHVDHGKTSLLDAIRQADVTSTEFGGITQHIGAYQVTYDGRTITFIDTPGHESFTAMRARGAQVTDIAVLVVAADDGVMPQTTEAIDHAKAAGVPIIVAVNKIDKEGANPTRVRQQLSEYHLVPEEWGGDTVFVDVSAKQQENLDQLLEMILLVADLHELKSNPTAEASGVVIEAKLDRGRGPVATMLVQRGTLKVGDAVVAGATYGRVRALLDAAGRRQETATPATPVEVIGLQAVPAAGEEFRVLKDERRARALAQERSMRERAAERGQAARPHVTLDDLFQRIREEEMKELNLIVKGDVQGSVEAVSDALERLDQSKVKLNIVRRGVGAITENDVLLASASDAIVIGFNVRPDVNAGDAADREGVDVRLYRVIYQLVDDIKAATIGMLEPEYEEVQVGRAEVIELFKVPRIGVVAGSMVQEGVVMRNSSVRLVRDGTVIYEGKVASLRRFKDDVREVRAGFDCGIVLENYQDVKEGDVIEVFEKREIPRSLD